MGAPTHTTTEMGNGGFYGSACYPYAAYDRNVEILYVDGNVYNAPLQFINSNTGICGWQASSHYNLSTSCSPGTTNSGNWGTYFFFGGG